MAIYSEDEDPNVTQWEKENLRRLGYKRFKIGVKVTVEQCYLEDESTEAFRKFMSKTATVLYGPSDEEELVHIEYESGATDYVPQDVLEVIN